VPLPFLYFFQRYLKTNFCTRSTSLCLLTFACMTSCVFRVTSVSSYNCFYKFARANLIRWKRNYICLHRHLQQLVIHAVSNRACYHLGYFNYLSSIKISFSFSEYLQLFSLIEFMSDTFTLSQASLFPLLLYLRNATYL
jgi:hypothetical protein